MARTIRCWAVRLRHSTIRRQRGRSQTVNQSSIGTPQIGQRWSLAVVAAFDVAPQKIGRVIDGCRCLPTSELASVVREHAVLLGIITVPVEAAQEAADQLVRAGVRGVLNFTPARLHVPQAIIVEDVDISVSLEKVAFFARRRVKPTETRI